MEPRRLDRARRRALIQRVEGGTARKIGPFGRFHARDAPAFLIDQDRQVGTAVEAAQIVRQPPQLGAILDIAAEEDIACGVAVAEESVLVVGQGQAREAENRGRSEEHTSELQSLMRRSYA